MTIKDNRAKTVIFADLYNGDTFICNNIVYLALPDVRYGGITYNAYNLTNECLTSFDDDATVSPVEVEIVIK